LRNGLPLLDRIVPLNRIVRRDWVLRRGGERFMGDDDRRRDALDRVGHEPHHGWSSLGLLHLAVAEPISDRAWRSLPPLTRRALPEATQIVLMPLEGTPHFDAFFLDKPKSKVRNRNGWTRHCRYRITPYRKMSPATIGSFGAFAYQR
jgi:hypothetical protein